MKEMGGAVLNLPADDIVARAIVVAGKYGPSDVVELVLRSKLANNTQRDELLEVLQRIDWKKLVDDAGEAGPQLLDALKSSNGPFAYLGKSPSAARAAKMMFEQIETAQKAGLNVVGIEKRIDILDASGKAIATGRKGQRDIDLVLEMTGPDGRKVFVELKGWTETIVYTTRTGEKIRVGAGEWFERQLDDPGSQLYKDIILFVTRRDDLGIDAFQGVKWYLTPEAIQSLGGVKKMVGDVIDGVKKNRAFFGEHFDVEDAREFSSIVNRLSKAMLKSGDEFFKSVD